MSQHNYYAFFDVDGTVTRQNRMLPFLHYCCWHYDKVHLVQRSLQYLRYRWQLKYTYREHSRECLNRLYYQQYAGLSQKRITLMGRKWFSASLAQNDNFFNKAIVDALKMHQDMGHKVVFVSGSFAPCVQPVANYFGVKTLLCVQPTIENGCYTGDIGQCIQTIGEGKVRAIKQYLSKKSTNITTYAYGDHFSDIPMLKFADTSTVITKDNEMNKYAKRVGWKLLY